MPRNGSGIYSKPAGTTAEPNTTIESAKYNQTIDDLVADANAARPIVAGGHGAATVSGAQKNLSLDNKVVYTAKSGAYTAVASDNNGVLRFTSAATLTLTAAATLGANWHLTVIADGGAVTIDPNASETIDGAATIVVPNGTSASIVCDGTGFYTQKPAYNSMGSMLQKGDLTGLSVSPTILLPTTYKAFRLVITDLNFSNGTQPFWLQFSTNGGASWISGATDYFEQTSTAAGTSAVLTQGSQAAASIILASSRDALQRAFSVIDIDPGNGSQLPTAITSSKWINSSSAMRGASIYTQAGSSLAQANALRLFPGAGTITTGFFSLYGYL